MESSLKEKVRRTIEDHKLIPSIETPVLVAVSGGCDSVALLHILSEIGYKCGIVHANFGLRGESDSDEEFVQQLSVRFQAPFHVRRFETLRESGMSGDSIQMIARKMRYKFLNELLANGNYGVCATAHHSSDQAETLIMHFLKGSSPATLKGIPIKRGKFIRPMMEISKTEIRQWCLANHIGYREDYTNAESKYIRNIIRNDMAKVMAKINPAWESHVLQKFADYSKQYRFLRHVAGELQGKIISRSGDKCTIDIGLLQELHDEKTSKMFLALILEEWGMKGKEISRVIELMKLPAGRRVEFPDSTWYQERKKLTVIFGGNQRFVTGFQEVTRFSSGKMTVRLGPRFVEMEMTEFAGKAFASDKPVDVHYLDADKIRWPLILRPWKKGDKMKPFGMQGTKKLSDIFVDSKMGIGNKLHAIVVADGEGVICLSGFRISESVKLDHGTRHALMLKFR